MTTEIRKHVWINNAAFARMTGIKKVCLVCGQPNISADASCPGKRLTPEAKDE
jgi:hypothetical protein